jgi:ribonuclease P protein component
MLPKKNRAHKKDIDLLFKKGGFVASPSFTFKFISQKISSVRISFIVPKPVSKKAVIRNLLRRRGYIALEKHIKNFPSGLLGVFIFKKPEENVSKIEHEIKNILDKIN